MSEETDAGDILGLEHFPTCACFQHPEHGRHVRDHLYCTAQEHANAFVTSMVMQGICREAMPYYIGLFVNMCSSMAASADVVREQGFDKITPEGNITFARLQREMCGRVKERIDALMDRVDRLTKSMSGGSSSVQ